MSLENIDIAELSGEAQELLNKHNICNTQTNLNRYLNAGFKDVENADTLRSIIRGIALADTLLRLVPHEFSELKPAYKRAFQYSPDSMMLQSTKLANLFAQNPDKDAPLALGKIMECLMQETAQIRGLTPQVTEAPFVVTEINAFASHLLHGAIADLKKIGITAPRFDRGVAA